MRTITKKNAAFGITGVAVASLAVVGFAAPATADTESEHTWDNDTSTTTEYSETQLDLLRGIGYTTGNFAESPFVLAPQVGVGDIASGSVGDVASGNAVASGNDVTAPIVSGNETAVGSGNDTAVGNNSGNGNSVGNVDTEVSDTVDGMVDSTNDLTSGISGSVSDLIDSVNVDGMVEDVTGSLDLGGILGDD